MPDLSIIQNNSQGENFVITLEHAKSLSLEIINSAISIWEKIQHNKRTVNLCHSQGITKPQLFHASI